MQTHAKQFLFNKEQQLILPEVYTIRELQKQTWDMKLAQEQTSFWLHFGFDETAYVLPLLESTQIQANLRLSCSL